MECARKEAITMTYKMEDLTNLNNQFKNVVKGNSNELCL